MRAVYLFFTFEGNKCLFKFCSLIRMEGRQTKIGIDHKCTGKFVISQSPPLADIFLTLIIMYDSNCTTPTIRGHFPSINHNVLGRIPLPIRNIHL